MYLSGTSMSASPIPIFGSPCSGPDCSSVIRALERGLDRLRQVGCCNHFYIGMQYLISGTLGGSLGTAVSQ